MSSSHSENRNYQNTTVRLADLTVTTDLIEGYTFTNCVIEGPAVVLLMDTEFQGNSFEGIPDFEALIWRIPPEKDAVVGAIGLSQCVFVRCNFRRVAIGVPEGQVEEVRRGFGVA